MSAGPVCDAGCWQHHRSPDGGSAPFCNPLYARVPHSMLSTTVASDPHHRVDGAVSQSARPTPSVAPDSHRRTKCTGQQHPHTPIYTQTHTRKHTHTQTHTRTHTAVHPLTGEHPTRHGGWMLASGGEQTLRLGSARATVRATARPAPRAQFCGARPRPSRSASK